MSMDKSIKYGKEKRKPYYGSKAIDPSCRCGGSCEWCQMNRHYKYLKEEEKISQKLKEYFNN